LSVSSTRHRSKTIAAFAGIAAAALVVVASCTSGSSSGSAEANYAVPSATSANQAVPNQTASGPERDAAAAEAGSAPAATGAAGAAGAAGSDQAAGQAPVVPVDGSQIIKTADLSIRLKVEAVPATDSASADREANATARSAAVAEQSAAVRGIATAAGGFVASADGGGSQISISLRVPVAQYDTVLDKLAAIGEVTNRTESSQDVTAEVVDVNSRVDTMTASVARVRELLAQATDIGDVIAIESELATREANLEALQQQQAYLAGQVAMSTVSLTLTAVTNDPTSTTEPSDETGFVAGVKAGWAGLLDFLTWIGGAFGALLPFLPIIAVVVLLAWWLIRRTRRRRAARVASPGPEARPTTPAQSAPVPTGEPVSVGAAPGAPTNEPPPNEH
jgi:hypothetical protein